MNQTRKAVRTLQMADILQRGTWTRRKKETADTFWIA